MDLNLQSARATARILESGQLVVVLFDGHHEVQLIPDPSVDRRGLSFELERLNASIQHLIGALRG